MFKRSVVGLAVLLVFGHAANARLAATNTELALRAGPGVNYELLADMPTGATVRTDGCAKGWCRVIWSSYAGYASQSGLVWSGPSAALAVPAPIPVYPDHPYHAGHYPTADSYHSLPPYAAMRPHYYRWRYNLSMDREWNRYRYVPYQFHGYSND